MINFKYELNETNIERCIEIIKRIPAVKTYYNNILRSYSNKYYNPYGFESFLEKIISTYKKIYNEALNDEEKTIIIMYYLIDNDETLKKDFIKAKFNIELVAKKYYVDKNLIKLRWNTMKKINKYNNNQKKLTLKNDEY